MSDLTLSWGTCKVKYSKDKHWCDLEKLNLDHEIFENLKGVYIIWSHKNVIRLGSGTIKERLKEIQNKLLVLGGFLASDEKGKEMMKDQIKEEDIKLLEEYIDEYNQKLPPLKHFILPGDEEVATHFHVARTVVRRAERRIVSLAAQEGLNPLIQKYVNRLSDLMFVLARYSEEVENKKWKSTNLNI